MRSETRVLTVLFADIRGFTRISETMDPEDLREYINEYLTRMTEVVHQHGGTLDKYIGDAVMAFWGAPIEDAMHADHAVSAALAMVGEAAALSQRYEARGWPALTIGVGVNSGECRVGDMGSKSRRAYTVLGDTVNLASRIEGLTKHFNLPVLVGPGTRDAAQAHSFADLGLMNVAGRVEPVQVFVPSVMAVTLPLPPSGPVSKDLQHAATRIGV
jgi:adenylate cyclase